MWSSALQPSGSPGGGRWFIDGSCPKNQCRVSRCRYVPQRGEVPVRAFLPVSVTSAPLHGTLQKPCKLQVSRGVWRRPVCLAAWVFLGVRVPFFACFRYTGSKYTGSEDTGSTQQYSEVVKTSGFHNGEKAAKYNASGRCISSFQQCF